ncbi:MAG TPA: hypothetical protein VEK07_23815 [Polyangiaceae bacterium]|nr:hypothetical protein [Polyangiaceae bacterium]
MESAITDREATERFLDVEREAIDWLLAADPRLAARARATASEAVLKKIGTEAVLAEDATAEIRGASLDLFAFRGRSRALERAASMLEGFRERLPDTAPSDAGVTRPRLEQELLHRLIDEEHARAIDEAELPDAAGDLVRGILSTWTPPSAPQDWQDRDTWVSKHLLEIRESLRDGRAHTGLLDLDTALYPLERLLAPLQFPRGAAALAEVRLALDADAGALAPLVDAAHVAAEVELHLGLKVDPRAMTARLERLEDRLRTLAQRALEQSPAPQATVARAAAQLLMVEATCPPVAGSRVRSMAPPPERALICGALRALTDESDAAAALVALHDDVLLSFAAITVAPPPRTRLLSSPENDRIDALLRSARERPVPSLGVALAAEILYSGEGADARLRAWRALGEAPLDVVAREIGAAPPPT